MQQRVLKAAEENVWHQNTIMATSEHIKSAHIDPDRAYTKTTVDTQHENLTVLVCEIYHVHSLNAASKYQNDEILYHTCRI